MENFIKTENEFEVYYRLYFNPLINFINSYITSREDSKEIVQNMFEKIWENRNSIVFRGEMKGYFFQAAKNAMIDFIRQNKKYRIQDSINMVDENKIKNIEDSFLDPYIIRQIINKSLHKLKPATREIFQLHFFEGLTQEEIASHLKVSKRKVEYQVALYLETLRKELKNNHIHIYDH